MPDQNHRDTKADDTSPPLHTAMQESSDNEKAMDSQHVEVSGYVSELTKNRSTAQVAFMSSVLSAIPLAISVGLAFAVNNGGPANMLWGFIAVSLVIFCVALSLGEITSVYPTAGGVYYQTFMLSSGRWRKLTAWVCGWSYAIGNILITLSVNFGTILFLIDSVNVFEKAPGVPIFEAKTYEVFLLFLALTVLCVAVSSLGNRWLPLIDGFATVLNICGGLAMLITMVATAKGGRNSAKYIFTEYEPISGWNPGWAFFIGLLMPAYATSSTGMIISISEEVKDPGIQVPKAMLWTITINTIAGTAYIIALSSILPDLHELAGIDQPLPYILKKAVGGPKGAIAVLTPFLLLAVICGIGCTTATSRCVWALARDGAVPGSYLWKRINKKLTVPLNAMLLSAAVQVIVAIINFGSTTAFNSFYSSGVIFLTISYTMPIIVSFFSGRKHLKYGRFHFKKSGTFANVVAIAWCALAVPLFCMPSYLPVTAESMNYASVVLVAFVLISAGWYWVWGYKNYHGPPINIVSAIGNS